MIRPWLQQFGGKDLFVGILPVAVDVEIQPGIQPSLDRGYHIDRGSVACRQRRYKEGTILVVIAVKVIAQRGGMGLSIRFRIGRVSQIGFQVDQVASTVVGSQCAIAVGGRVAIVLLLQGGIGVGEGGLFGIDCDKHDAGQNNGEKDNAGNRQ